MIHTVDSLIPVSVDDPRAPAEQVPAIWARRSFGVRWKAPRAVAVGATTDAYVNDSRWVAKCVSRGCAGAELVSRTDPRFWCCSCQNAGSGGLWVTVTFPADADRIEEMLDARSLPTEKHWRPGETVSDLHAENKVHGVAA